MDLTTCFRPPIRFQARHPATSHQPLFHPAALTWPLATRYNTSPHSSRRIIKAFFSVSQVQSVEWTDAREQFPQINWSGYTPLNSIGMPYTCPLLSSWTLQFFPSANPSYLPQGQNTTPDPVKNQYRRQLRILYQKSSEDGVVISTAKDQCRFRNGEGRRDDGVSLSNVLPSCATHPQHRASSSISLATTY